MRNHGNAGHLGHISAFIEAPQHFNYLMYYFPKS